MPIFDTPHPISIRVDLGAGTVRVDATVRTDTVVEVTPSDPDRPADVEAAEHTRVEFTDGRLVVDVPRRRLGPLSRWGSVEVAVAAPAGSDLAGDAGVGALSGQGRLGGCHFHLGAGGIRLERTGSLRLRSGAGDIAVERATGHAEVRTGAGTVRIGAVDGPAELASSSGDVEVGEVAGDARLKAANGDISVGRAGGSLEVQTSRGGIRLGQVERGSVVARTGMGDVEVGIRPGVRAWLDLDTRFGTIERHLDPAGEPAPGDQPVEVRARTSMGDITVRRSAPRPAGSPSA